MHTENRAASIIIYVIIVILAVLLLYIGNRVAIGGASYFISNEQYTTIEARALKILETVKDEYDMGGFDFYSITTTFEAQIGRGRSAEVIIATQEVDNYSSHAIKPIEPGDRIMVMMADGQWYFQEYVRINGIMILGAVFIVLMIFFGRMKGLNAILTLGLTCVAIFAVFIPALLSGRNIYAWAMAVCAYSIIVTLFIVVGINQKSLAAVAGCFGGVISAALLILLMSWALKLTGVLDSESVYLYQLRGDNPIDLKAIIFAGIIIGAVGAFMDVAMSISSALWEIKSQSMGLTFSEIFESGMNIGRDIMGTMANTLVLAYIGNSLTIILLLVTYSTSLSELMNREMIIVELLQAVIGSFGIMLTMPLTTLICAFLFSREQGFGDSGGFSLFKRRTKW